MSETMPTLYDDVRPLVDPILLLLKSRKAVVALITAGVDLLVLAVPSLLPVRDQLLTILTVLGLSLMGLTAGEDMVKTHAAAKVAVAQALAGKPLPMVISSPEA